MITVPVLIAALVGSLCVGFVFEVFEHETGFGLEESGDFYWTSRKVAKSVVRYLDDSKKENANDKKKDVVSSTEKLLDRSSMRMEIIANDKIIYDYGSKSEIDEKLINAAKILDKEGSLATSGNRTIFKEIKTIGNTNYQIFIIGTKAEGIDYSLKVVIAVAALIVICSVIIAVVMTNRFLIKFVFKKIETPLDILVNGVQEIGSGNLNYRINYDENNEFTPICKEFNEMADRLKESIEQTKRNEESRKELMAGISHDLRSPLTSIRAYVEGLLDGIADTPETKNLYLQTIKRKAEDIERMVSQIFTFSKLELKEYPMKFSEIQLDFELSKMVEESALEYKKRGLILNIGQMCNYIVNVDFEQFCRVISNVIENSVKYKTKEIGHLDISIKSYGSRCELILTDDGPGVPEETLPKLFDVFYRSDPSRKNPSQGNGLGLAISEKIIQKMNGMIRAENAATGGLSIIITLNGREGLICGKNFNY